MPGENGVVGELGENAVNAITRLMGLILATIGTQMAIAGVSAVLSPAGT